MDCFHQQECCASGIGACNQLRRTSRTPGQHPHLCAVLPIRPRDALLARRDLARPGPTDSEIIVSPIHAAKLALRKEIIAARDAMPASQRKLDSMILCGRLAANIRYQRARAVLAYAGFGSEVDTGAFLKQILADGKVLALPRIDKDSNALVLYRVKALENDLEAGQWGILEPKPDPARIFALREAEFVLVPGLAFDADCNRMGYGKAFYDRLFTDCPGQLPYRLAVAFDCQIVSKVPVGMSDVPLEAVITPTREYSR